MIIINFLLNVVSFLFLLGLIFIPLEIICDRNYSLFRPFFSMDLTHLVVGICMNKIGFALAKIVTTFIIDLNFVPFTHLNLGINQLNLYLQLGIALIIGDLFFYFGHRLAHTTQITWSFHKIHHSIQQMDWLAGLRGHPLEQLGEKIFQSMPLYLLGFSQTIINLYVIITILIDIIVHVNIPINTKVVSYLIVTPQFHHWHHELNHNNINFAGKFPFIDYLFGTYYLPYKQAKQ